jgi:PAS domain-containing protein
MYNKRIIGIVSSTRRILRESAHPRAAGLRQGAPFSTEQRVPGNDGQYRWFLVRYRPLLDEQGHIVRWYVAAFDIEDRKRAVDQLQLLASMMDSIPAAVWSVLPDGILDIVNQASIAHEINQPLEGIINLELLRYLRPIDSFSVLCCDHCVVHRERTGSE